VCLVDDVDEEMGREGVIVVGEIFCWSFFVPGTHLLPSFSLA